MFESYPVHGPTAWRRRGWLALIGGAHLLMFVAWQTPQRPLAASVAPLHAITYILAPVQPLKMSRPVAPRLPTPASAPLAIHVRPPVRLAAEKEAARPAEAAEAAEAARTTPPTPPQVATQPIPSPQAITQTIPSLQAITQTMPPSQATTPMLSSPDPFAEPAAKPADDLKQRSLKSAAAIDKQLRKEAWNPRDKKIANDTTVLADKIAGAYVGNNGVMTTEQITMPDGRLMTKVRTPGGGSFCAYKQSNSLHGGLDPIRDGIRTLVTNCPR